MGAIPHRFQMSCIRLAATLMALTVACATSAQINPAGPDPRDSGERHFNPVWGVILIRIDSIVMVPTVKMDKRIAQLRARSEAESDSTKATKLTAQLGRLEKSATRKGEWLIKGPATARDGTSAWSLGVIGMRISRSHGVLRKAAEGDYLEVLNPQYVKGSDWHSAEYRVGLIDAPDIPSWWIGGSGARTRMPTVPSAGTVRHPILTPSSLTKYEYHAPSPNATEMEIADVITRAMPAVFTVVGIGSGFVINADGIALTNRHVVEDDLELEVRFANGRVAKAVILGVANHPDADWALLDLEGNGYPFIPLGSSANLQLGQEVILIGAPHGYEHSVSKGIVSAFRDYHGVRVIQTDGAINPGNSGGPMIDRTASVVGIATFIRRDSEGLNFALGIDDVLARFPLVASSPAGP